MASTLSPSSSAAGFSFPVLGLQWQVTDNRGQNLEPVYPPNRNPCQTLRRLRCLRTENEGLVLHFLRWGLRGLLRVRCSWSKAVCSPDSQLLDAH